MPKKRNWVMSKYYLSGDLILLDDWLVRISTGHAVQLVEEVAGCIRVAIQGTRNINKQTVDLLVNCGVLNLDPPFSAWRRSDLNVYFELTAKCNLNCRYCFNRTFKRNSEVPLSFWLSLVASLPPLATITLFGGEPTLHPHVIEVIRAIGEREHKLILFTNGVNLNDDVIRALAGSTNPCVKISLDGPPAVHDLVRGSGNFEHVCATIKRVRENGIPVVVKAVKSRFLLPEAVRLMEILAQLDVQQVGFGDMILYGNASRYADERPAPSEELEVFGNIEASAKRLSLEILDHDDYTDPMVNTCGCGDNLLYIRSDGMVSGCTVLSEKYSRDCASVPPPTKEGWVALLPSEFQALGYLSPVCSRCPLVNVCMGGCRGRAFFEHGSVWACDRFRKKKIGDALRSVLNSYC
jgi:radical SAM protein with 4Fe4S-binding SPASM domain